MVAQPCFRPGDESGLTKDCLRRRWRSLASLLHDLLGPELAQKFVNDVVWRDEVPTGSVTASSITELSTEGAVQTTPWHGSRLNIMDIIAGSGGGYAFTATVDGTALRLEWREE